MSLYDDNDSFFEADPGDEAFQPDSAADAVTTGVLLSGETGVAYEAVALFAEPMFQLYEMDSAEAFLLKENPEMAQPELVTVLSTARLLWAFFSLSGQDRVHKRTLLAAHLVGRNPTEDDWIEIEGLLESIEPYWSAMLPDEIQTAEDNGFSTLGFDELLAHPAFQLTEEPSSLSYGTESLSEIEARAMFAQPLLEDPEILLDEDAFEHAMERANAYWALATTPAQQQKAAMEELAARFGGNGSSKDTIRAEAKAMVDRYQQLFSK